MSTLSAKSTVWLRSSYSVGMNNCVETARLGAAVLAVRDSKNTAGPALLFAPPAWVSFIESLRNGGFGPGPSHAAGS